MKKEAQEGIVYKLFLLVILNLSDLRSIYTKCKQHPIK